MRRRRQSKQLRVTAGTGVAVGSRESDLEPVLDIVTKLSDQTVPPQLRAENLTAD